MHPHWNQTDRALGRPKRPKLRLRSAWLTLGLLSLGPVSESSPAPGLRPTPATRLQAAVETHTQALTTGPIRRSASGFELRGAGFAARFGPHGALFTDTTTGLELGIEARRLRHGDSSIDLGPSEPAEARGVVHYQRIDGVEERFKPTDAGLEHSLLVERPLGHGGDLVVEFRLSGSALESAPEAHAGGWRLGGISIGALTAIDASGAQVAGRLELEGERLEWVVPEKFLAQAAWPLLLDPLIGSGFQLSFPQAQLQVLGPYQSDSQPSVAYDQTTDTYLAVWTRLDFNPNQSLEPSLTLLGQRFSATGQPLGQSIPISSVNPSSSPAVVSVNRSNRFAVAWVQEFFGESQVRVRLVDASTGNLSNSLFVQGLPAGQIGRVALAGEPDASLTTTGQVWLAWDSPTGIRGARVLVPNSPAQPTIAANFNWVSGSNLSQPALSRTPSANGRLGLAWVAGTSGGTASSVWANVFSTGGTPLAIAKPVSGNVERAIAPRIDGGDAGPGYYTVVFESVRVSCDILGINCVDYFRGYRSALSFNGSLSVGAAVELGPEASARSSPNVGWRNNRMFLTYQEISGTDSMMRLLECDPKTGAVVDGPTSIDSDQSIFGSSAFTNPAICLDASGGDSGAPRGVLLYSRGITPLFFATSASIRGRFLTAFSPLAAAIDFGGACGLGGGGYQVNSPPAVGNGNFRARLLFPGAGTSVAVFNLAFSSVPIPCGGCQWVPFESTTVLPGNPNLVELALPIPCNPALIGLEVLSQWTVIKPSANECPSFPGIAVSNILSLRPH